MLIVVLSDTDWDIGSRQFMGGGGSITHKDETQEIYDFSRMDLWHH